MRLRFFVPMAAIAAASMMVAPEARACGGCFQQQDATVVTGHRMVLSISPTQTVLWDQFQYTGDPKDFAWVLPVRAGAYIETSTDAWFETLDAATTATVLSPQIACPSSGGFGCGAAEALSAGDRGGNQTGVIVLHEGTVGPYETVTLKATQPGALNNWLTQNGYKIDPTTQPIIDAYVSEGFDFIALRLAPNAGVRQMKPVRVLSQGADPSLPLRMVAAGTGAQVAFTLFTISEARYETKNFHNALTPRDLLLWNFETNKSNYADLRLGLMEQNEGETWLTVYAKQRALLSSVTSEAFFGGPVSYTSEKGEFFQTIAEAYVARGRDNGESSDTSCTSAFGQVAESGDVVVNPCPFGAKADDPACGMAGANEIDSRSLACGALDDLAVALRGLHPQDVWLTRLEANLPRAALGKDLSLTPASDQLPVDNFMTAKVHTGSPCPSALPAVGTGGGGQDRGRSFPVGLAVGALLFGAALARRMRSRGRLVTA